MHTVINMQRKMMSLKEALHACCHLAAQLAAGSIIAIILQQNALHVLVVNIVCHFCRVNHSYSSAPERIVRR